MNPPTNLVKKCVAMFGLPGIWSYMKITVNLGKQPNKTWVAKDFQGDFWFVNPTFFPSKDPPPPTKPMVKKGASIRADLFSRFQVKMGILVSKTVENNHRFL